MRITLHHKPLDVRLSRSAGLALAAGSGVLLVELELVFACMIRKRVSFRKMDCCELADEAAVSVNTGLAVRFVPLMSRAACSVGLDAAPVCEPLDDPRPYVPRWLAIDYRRGQWLGEFGYEKTGQGAT